MRTAGYRSSGYRRIENLGRNLVTYPQNVRNEDRYDAHKRMTMTSTVPRLAYISATFFSFALAAIVILAFLQIGPSLATTYILPPFVCGVAALFFSSKWPQGSWRWGIILSCGFWAFFVLIFFSYLSVGQVDWLPAVRALSALIAGTIGSTLGTTLRHYGRKH